MRRQFTLYLLTLALALGACASTDDNYIPGTPLEISEFDELWQRAQDVLARQGYRPDPDLTRRSERELVTTWKVDLQPFRFEGKRRRAHLKFVELTDGKWTVDVWLEQERNAEIEHTLNVLNADWEDDPEGGADRATEIQYKIEFLFLPRELAE